MNKQQLAATIWESAQNLRGKIEANDYKDYILGFIFYKYLSDKQVDYLVGIGMPDEYFDNLTTENEYVKEIKSTLGYFIESKDLFGTWIESGNDFTVVNLPLDSDEQIAIGSFFKILDETISFQKKQIEHLQNIKKSLLEKMFI